MLYLVCTRSLTQTQGDQLSPLFKVLGVDGIEERVLSLFKHTQFIPLKEQLLAMIFHSESGLELFENLSDQERVELCGPWMRPMVMLSKSQSFPRYALCALYTSTPQEQQPYLLEKIEHFRARQRLNPCFVYEILIKQGLSPLHSMDFFSQIYHHGDLKELLPLLDEAPKELRTLYQKWMNLNPDQAS